MSKVDFVLEAQSRENIGKGASRRLRREQGLVPGIIYGDEKAPKMISLAQNKLIKQLGNEAFYSHIITVNVDGNSEMVILKDLQRHPAKPEILHIDLLRVAKGKKFTTKVPLHFTNEDICKGVKTQGGIVSHNINELEISCMPKDLPEFIEVDLINLEMGGSVHISDITLPEGVESVELSHGEGHNLAVANIVKPRGIAEEEEGGAEAPAAAEEDSSES